MKKETTDNLLQLEITYKLEAYNDVQSTLKQTLFNASRMYEEGILTKAEQEMQDEIYSGILMYLDDMINQLESFRK